MNEEEDEKGSSIQGSETKSGLETSESIFKFRNYTPQTHFLDGLYRVDKSKPETINHLIQDRLDLITSEETGLSNPENVDPQKVDWDLKRRISKRLETLERHTQKSIKEHIKQTRQKR